MSGLVLGIETSCDETAAALVTEEGEIRSSVVSSQAELHARYGGVVPEVASRRHLELVTPVIREALVEADASLEDVDVRGRVCVGDGAVRYRVTFEEHGAEIPPDADPAHVPHARFHAQLAEHFGPADGVEPVYLRAPDAKPSVP